MNDMRMAGELSNDSYDLRAKSKYHLATSDECMIDTTTINQSRNQNFQIMNSQSNSLE